MNSNTPPRRERSRSSILAQGMSSVWLTGSAMTVALLMIVGLLALVVILGGQTFWPRPLIEVQTSDGKTYLGEVTHDESYRPDSETFARLPPLARARAEAEVCEADGKARRRQFRTGNYQETGFGFKWISDFEIVAESQP